MSSSSGSIGSTASAGNVFRCTADGREIRAWDVPAKIGSMALRKDGKRRRLLAAERLSCSSTSRPASALLIHDPEPDKPATRINDGKVDRRGRFVAGSMDTMEAGPNGALYRLDPDFKVTKLDDGIIVSNGPCLEPRRQDLLFRRYLVGRDLGL